MDKYLSRRDALKLVAAAGVAASTLSCASNQSVVSAKPMLDKWRNTHNRPWLGGEYWANPMEDWHIVNGRAECKSRSGNRSIHSLTHRIEDPNQPFSASVVIRQVEKHKNDGGAGIRLGVNNEINEYRSSCFVQRGLDIGVIGDQLKIANKATKLTQDINHQDIKLNIQAAPQAGAVSLTAQVILVATQQTIAELTQLLPASEIKGNIAVVSNFALRSNVKGKDLGSRYQFSEWVLDGDAFTYRPERKFGPILWTMYSLNNTRSPQGYTLKLSAFTGPMGKQDSHQVELQSKISGVWVTQGVETLDPDAWVATFKIPNWDQTSETEFRVVYKEQHIDGTHTPDIWQGVIKAEPKGRALKMAALTCQNDYSFPYAPVAENVQKLNPDIVFFSGDQIYESHGGFGIIRTPFEPAIHNYLRKFYQFGWAFGEVMRNQPTLVLPDDHDVLQGNLWGEGGQLKKNPEQDPTASLTGGYIESVRFVNAVHRTCVSHHPDPYDPTPNPSGISCYYTDMVYGDVGFAILADRQWKSGPEQAGVVVGETGVGEDPNYLNPNINPADPQLLGDKQQAFFAKWGQDWRAHKLKAILSQTVFAGIATHQPSPERYLKYDFDSSGWPAPARDVAVNIMRKSKALHICGDTHLTSLAQYGVNNQRDSNWSFCTPAISAGWPRFWLPDQMGIPHQNRPKHNLPQTGEFLDAFGNKMYVYAVGMPEVAKSNNRYIRAHEKGSGFGFITFNTDNLTYTLDAYRFLINVEDKAQNNQFAGWPVTIHMQENAGDNKLS
ncbi:alkaline phosphatase D family protein [Catenovulum sediminis]|uniref:Alkaline phosphatase D family protein n=1 Tax=Catenovulum sediminis TaxID=1740262 RepID=A0ABV1RCU1_9ALTE